MKIQMSKLPKSFVRGVKNSRVQFAESATYEGPAWRKEPPSFLEWLKWANSLHGIAIQSVSDPSVRALTVFDISVWHLRNYRALVLRQARAKLMEKLSY